MDFFKREDLEFFKSIAGTPYRAKNEESSRKSERIKPIVKKSNFWANQLRERLPGFQVENNRYWQTGKSFRKYTWHKVYKEKDQDKLIFFTIGIEALHASLLIKLDCMRDIHGNSSEVLSEEKIQRFNNFMSGQDVRTEIFKDELDPWDWERLVSCAADFVRDNVDLYEDAIENVHLSKGSASTDKKNTLVTPSSTPDKIYSNVRERKRSFKGVTTYWEKEYNRAERLGLAGEQFIIQQERLKHKGSELAGKVKKVKDGNGYDIRSFDKKGNEIFIEVKTTTNGKNTPFYMSENEKAYVQKEISKYLLYRVFNFDRELGSGDYFILNGNELMDNGDFNPISYEVSYLKDK